MRLFRRRRVEREALTYSNESVVKRIQVDAGVDRETARAPPKPVDVAWHAFILHTRDYEAYCRERFGRVIHHEPTGEPDPEAYRRAYERRAQHGPVDGAVWVVPAGLAAGDGQSEGGASESGPSSGDIGGAGAGDFGGSGGSSCAGGGGCGGGGG